MDFPPAKRLRGLDQNVVTAVPNDDTFGDDDEFTQEDLDEIDIIASQATSSAGLASKSVTNGSNSFRGSTCPTSVIQSRTTANQSNAFVFNRVDGTLNKEPLNNKLRPLGSDREDSYQLLETQHAELKKKLKEVEEEILLKSGEIRVLRDSLKAAQQEKETQRQNQVLLEAQRQKEQNEKEKELNRKVQSLQSELQFKEAEISDMKTKLLCSENNKIPSPMARNSPKVLSTSAQMHHGSSSSPSSPIGSGFITKEAFGMKIPSRTTPLKACMKTHTAGAERRMSSSRCDDGNEVSQPDPFLSAKPACFQHEGGVLLGLLLQPSLSPCNRSLSHLLSMSLTDYRQLSTDPQLHFNPPDQADPVAAPREDLNLVQSLAATGLNMLSQSQTTSAASSRNNGFCSGAVLLLPLLDLHLTRLCSTLDSLRSSSPGSSRSDSGANITLPVRQTISSSPGLGRLEEAGFSGFSVEDTGLTSLRVLYVLLAHSDEVVKAVLTNQTTEKGNHAAAHKGFCSQNALLQSLLCLCDTQLCGGNSRTEELALNALKTLCVLIRQTPSTHSDRLQCVLQVVCTCLSADSSVRVVSECVSVLTAMSDHQNLVKQLCSQHNSCVLLKLFQFIRTRLDYQATHTGLVLLDLQVVRLLGRLSQRADRWLNVENTCPCSTELVQTVVILFHHQWLHLHGSTTGSAGVSLQRCSPSSSPWWHSPAAALLRECLLLLHWLLQHHASFSDSCRPLLHMYDQMIPAVRETLRKIPDLSESEELALEEICRSEGDDTDDMDIDASS
uniref:ATR interacting protein n=2 Tax=Nothobranchius pienaari TaxID=704102 RepID=A0A1A8MLV9_9TELE